KDRVDVGRGEGTVARLVQDGLAGRRRKLGDDLPARLAPDERAAHGASVADCDGIVRATTPLPGLQIREVGAVAFARVHHMVAGAADCREHAPNGLDGRPMAASRHPKTVKVPVITADLVLHLADYQLLLSGQ